MRMNLDQEERLIELLCEIESICVGADSPDAIANGKNNPIDELENCRSDLKTISKITEELKDIVSRCSED